MSTTGYIRRTDELGRIVIPKELRQTHHIHKGDALLLCSGNDGEIVIKKYSRLDSFRLFARKYAEVLFNMISAPIMICDLDSPLTISGLSDPDIIKCRLSHETESMIVNRKIFCTKDSISHGLKILDDLNYTASIIHPIVACGEVVGAVVMCNGNQLHIPTQTDIQLTKAAAEFLGSIMED